MSWQLPQVWGRNQDSRFNRFGAIWPDFLSPEQKVRAERIRQSTMLFDNQHREYFLDEGRTQHKFPEIDTDGATVRPYTMNNVLRLISLKTGDLLFGTEPLIRVEDEIQQQKLSALSERTALHPLILGAAIGCTFAGECFLNVRIFRGQVYITQIPAAEIFPNGDIQPDREYASYTHYSFQRLMDGQRQRCFLMETTFAPGSILRNAWELDAKGEKKNPIELNSMLNGKLIFADGDQPFAPEEQTGIASNTIIYVPNFQGESATKPESSYDGLLDLQDSFNALETQIDNVTEQHGSPWMHAEEQQGDDENAITTRNRVLYHRSGTEPPGYIVRDLQLDGLGLRSKALLSRICVFAEMSPALLGLDNGATSADTWKKFKLSATNALAMAQRKAAVWRPALRKLMGVAQDLECTIPGVRYDRGPISAEMMDGIPSDDLDVASYISSLRASGAMSRERAVELQIPDRAGQQKENERLAEEQANATPSIFFGESTGGNQGAGNEPAASGDASAQE